MDIRKIIKEILGLDSLPKGEGLTGFSDEQLKAAEQKVREQAAEAKGARNAELLEVAVATFEAVRDERTARTEAARELDAKITDLDARITAETTEEVKAESDPEPAPEPTPDPESEGDGDNGDAAPEVAPATTPEVAPVAVSAAPEPATPITPAPVVPAPSALPITSTTSPVTIVAAVDVKGFGAGSDLKQDELGDAFVGKAAALTRSRKPGKLDVATLEVEFPTDRMLSAEDSTGTNTEKIMSMIATAQAETRKNLDAIMASTDATELASLTAAGGLCAPVNVRYDIFELGSDVRPLRDALLRFGATRGGIRFNAPPVLADVDGSVAIYSETDDTNSTGYPKDCIRVDCGADVEVAVSAITLCMEVGNFQRLSFPENFRAWWKLGKVLHARTAEDFLWDRMVTLSLALTSSETGLGTSREVLATLARGAQQYRDRFRIGDETPIRAYMPSWLVTMMQIDLMRQAPGDSAVGLARSTIVRYFAAFNVATTFVLDGQASSDSGYTQLAGGLNDWPTEVDIIYTVDGTFIHLDMGSLDFGTEIRDFTQIRNNDSGAFLETFENVARVGPEAGRLRIVICNSGQTAGPNTSYDPCTGY